MSSILTVDEDVPQSTVADIVQKVVDNITEKSHISENNNLQESCAPWIDQLLQLKSLAANVSSFAHKFDYSQDIQYNGCRLYLKIVERYASHLLTGYDDYLRRPSNKKNEKKMGRLMGQCYSLNVIGRSLTKYHLIYEKHYSDTMYSSEAFSKDLVDVFIEFQESLTEDKCRDFFAVDYMGLWLPDWVRKIFKTLGYHFFMSANRLDKSLIGVPSNRKVTNFLTRWALNFEIGPFARPSNKFFSSTLYKISMWMWIKKNSDIRVSYPKLTQRQTAWLIKKDSKNGQVIVSNDKPIAAGRQLKCALLEPRDHKSKDLILFIHGGGFVSMTAESIIPLLQPIVRQTQTPALSVDYTLSPEAQFPVACQEILDVYLDLLRDESFIGYTPERIIVSGESAGAYFALTLPICLAEIRHIQQSSPDIVADVKCVPLPHSVHAIYPVSSLTSANLFPSRSIIDFLLQPSGFLPVFNAYAGPFEEDISSDKLNWKVAPWHKNRWTVEQVTSVLSSLADNCLVNPVGYKHFDRLASVPLYVTVGELDPLLDDSITIAKRWKGPVTLDVIPESPHGLMTFEFLAPKNFTGGKLTRQRFVQSLG